MWLFLGPIQTVLKAISNGGVMCSSACTNGLKLIKIHMLLRDVDSVCKHKIKNHFQESPAETTWVSSRTWNTRINSVEKLLLLLHLTLKMGHPKYQLQDWLLLSECKNAAFSFISRALKSLKDQRFVFYLSFYFPRVFL